MMPKMDPRQMARALKSIGVDMQDIEAKEVIIRCEGKDIIIKNPKIQLVNMMGNKSYQISGDVEEREAEADAEEEEELEVSDEDVKMVMAQTHAAEDKARAVLKQCKGDIAEAIMALGSE